MTRHSKLIHVKRKYCQVLYVDNDRNAAVNIGDRDIKDDVKAKKLRERSVS